MSLINYKTKIIFILITGFFIVSIITAISVYSAYQYKFIKLQTNANKIVQLFDDTLNDIIKDLKYFQTIDYKQDSKSILKEFKNISSIMYQNNKNINAVILINQFENKEYEKNLKELRYMTDDNSLQITPITDIIKGSKKTYKNNLSSIIVHREPTGNIKKVIGVDLASEFNRYQTITSMNINRTYNITAPVNLVNRYQQSKINSVIYYPLYKNENEDYYKWYAAIPFTYKKILDHIVLDNPLFNDLRIEILNNDNIIVGTHGKYLDKHDEHDHITVLLESTTKIANERYLLKIGTNSIFTFATFWQNILGFTSGIFFLFFIGYYLFYKEQKNIEISVLKLRLSEAQKISSSGHCVWKSETNNFTCSEGLTNILDLDNFSINTHELFNMIFKDDKQNVLNLIQGLKNKSMAESGNITFRMIVNSDLKWLKIEYRVFYNNDDINSIQEVFIVAQDITSYKSLEISLKENNAEFKKIAITDHLTNIYNRAYFDKEVQNALNKFNRYHHIFSILLIDIDHFKNINDTFGHIEGDNVLIKFAEIINLNLRQTDIFARWGGEEFVILIPYTNKENAIIVADKIRIEIQNYRFSNKYNITCSIGVTQIKKGDTKSSLLTRVDQALYEAKEDGRNKVKLS